MSMWSCPLITETPHSDFLLTVLAAFTIIFFLIRLFVEGFKGSKNPAAVMLYEFYGQNPTHAYLIDALFMLSYFAVTLAIVQMPWGQDWELMPTVRFFLVLAVVIVVLNMLIKFLVDAMAPSNPGAHFIQFFKRWADVMGFRAMLWDWVYLGLVALLAMVVLMSGLHKWIWVVAVFWLMVTGYFLTISEQ